MLKQICKSTAAGTKPVLQKATGHFVLHTIYCLNSWANIPLQVKWTSALRVQEPLQQLCRGAQAVALGRGAGWLNAEVPQQFQPHAPAQPEWGSNVTSEFSEARPTQSRQQHGESPRRARLLASPGSSAIQLPPSVIVSPTYRKAPS